MHTQQLCPLCKESNCCALVQTGDASHCWCMEAKIAPEILNQIAEDQINKSCICPKCALKLPS